MNIETANRLLQYRKENKLSQEELAEKIGVSRQAVSKWERAEASPDTDNLIRLAEIYGVSLDEMLTGKKTDNTENAEAKSDEPQESSEDFTPDENTEYIKHDKVSFKNGIHVESKDGNKVHISFKDGVNVYEKEGNRVHAGWDGVQVDEKGKNRVYTDENGNVMVDKKLQEANWANPNYKILIKFPFWAIALAAFLAWGFSGLCFGWALSWICLLTIPLYYSLIDAIFKKNPSHFAFPVLAVAAYIIFGYFKICGGWAFGWIVFLTIPVYYCVCSLINSGKSRDE